MHTRKRHQEMFQDRNKKLQSADKESESPPGDAKAAKRWSVSSASSDKTSMSVKTSTFFFSTFSSDLVLLLSVYSIHPPEVSVERSWLVLERNQDRVRVALGPC